MPRYVYACPDCGYVQEEVMKMCSAADAPNVYCTHRVTFPDGSYGPCATKMMRQVAQVHTDLKDFAKPIEMFSVGCNSTDEIRQMQAAGIECSDNPSDPLHGVPIARNRAEKKRALKVAGFQEAN